MVDADDLIGNDVTGSDGLHLQYTDAGKQSHITFNGDLQADVHVAAAAPSSETNQGSHLLM